MKIHVIVYNMTAHVMESKQTIYLARILTEDPARILTEDPNVILYCDSVDIICIYM